MKSRRLAILELARNDEVLSRLIADSNHQLIYAMAERGTGLGCLL